ncbi:DUF993 family protein [Variovorax guangxiensis]|uniref:Uncharacterized protein n=1 Tax=Variovorax guangxiensis TaxID=1775474 RepID=A0A840G035_9BURK|nr:hypothetical protein [Variovorax guangxiensis]
MDTAQRGMGVDRAVARQLIQRSLRHARTVSGADLARGVGTDQLVATPDVTIEQVEAAYRGQPEVVEAEGGRAILMASRALVRCAKSADDYLALYGRLLKDTSKPVILHWLGEMLDPALRGYWGTTDIPTAQPLFEVVRTGGCQRCADRPGTRHAEGEALTFRRVRLRGRGPHEQTGSAGTAGLSLLEHRPVLQAREA